MNVVIDPKAGFCGGVKRAIKMVEKALKEGDEIFVRGELIHNPREMERLCSLGLEICGEIDGVSCKSMFIRTHGETPNIYRQANSAGIEIIDATCKNVRRSQKIIAQAVKEKRKIYIFGKEYHPEVIGLLGYCGGNGKVLQSIEEVIPEFIENVPSLLIPQTTADPDKFEALRLKMVDIVSILQVYNAICPFVSQRESELQEFAKSIDALIFIGGRHSSNTTVLFAVCKEVNPNSFFVEKPEELPLEELSQFEAIGISGSASTPMWQLEETAATILEKID
ncbi:MAG: 4-hydroxy-3-methylbut-2-enyl diphosphate reductase [candidate division Zixibacteria bacterium]|nr:4-hydroxy-3-methylbut-2-enyl diphosphate reductase [Candidatus Tariuqbacter arcticus]